MEQNKKLDFDGQPIFCGIDVHKKSWKVTVRTDLVELKTFSQPPSATALMSFLKHRYPAASYRVVYEAGFCGFHLQRQLQALGVDCIIANPADVPTMDKEKQQKSDAVDSRKLSKSLSAGMLEGIYVPTVQEQDILCRCDRFAQGKPVCKPFKQQYRMLHLAARCGVRSLGKFTVAVFKESERGAAVA
jgi:transposase